LRLSRLVPARRRSPSLSPRTGTSSNGRLRRESNTSGTVSF
jgi:hypothetical protein